ncbi:MAG: cobalamin B12-binding domain-containing protein, partial [Pseudomonadota bacterium]
MSQYDQTEMRGLQRNRPEDVGALATTVISVLRDRQVVSREGVRQFALDHLMRAILSRAAFDPALLMEEMRGHRLTIDAIIDLYIPQAARTLGQNWVDDEISFADVTIGALRLQSLLSEASLGALIDLPTNDTLLHAMVVLPQGEQHFLGVSVVAAQLRRAGCEVSVSFDETLGRLSARVLDESPDLVLISCARREGLETVVETVQTIHAASVDSPIVALGGAVLADAEDLKERTGVDIVTSTAKDAVTFCSKCGQA